MIPKVKVREAQYKGDYRIWLKFSNGVEGTGGFLPVHGRQRAGNHCMAQWGRFRAGVPLPEIAPSLHAQTDAEERRGIAPR